MSITSKYDHEKRAARERARVTPYDLPLPKFCPWPNETGGRCGGELHAVDQVRGQPILDSRGNPTAATICEKCHHVTVYEVAGGVLHESGGETVARSADARKRAKEFADELNKTGVLIEGDGGTSRIAVALEGKHWKIRTAQGAFIYSFSTTPSDMRSMKNNESQLRRLNVRWGEDAEKAAAKDGQPQQQAAPTGELTEAQERTIAVRARLVDLQQQLSASIVEMVKIGFDAADKRKIWRYRTESSAGVQMGRFLTGKMWGDKKSLDFFEAMADEIEGVPPEKFGTATPAITHAPSMAPEPEPEPEPAPAPTPAPQPSLRSRRDLENRDDKITELRAAMVAQDVEIEQLHADIRRLSDEKTDLLGKLDAQRTETLSAEALVRKLQESPQASAPAGSANDPLYIKALRKLVSASSTEDEIREAFEMAMEIAKGQL